MELETTTLMMMFFILFLVISIWKIYVFLPNQELIDDDTNQSSKEELTRLLLEAIKNSDGNLTEQELFERIKSHQDFDTKHFWRFNHNRLKQLLNHYYLQNPDTKSIKDIYKNL